MPGVEVPVQLAGNKYTGCSEILVIFGNTRISKPYNLLQSLIAQFISNNVYLKIFYHGNKKIVNNITKEH